MNIMPLSMRGQQKHNIMATDISQMMSENVILIDSTYADEVAFNLTVNFERMLERRIPQADLAHWLDCVALDGGIEPGENAIDVIFIHEKGKNLSNFTPSKMEEEINGKAFKDHLGEFVMAAYPIADDVTSAEDFYVETLRVLLDNEKVTNIVLVPNMEKYSASVLNLLKKKHKGTDVTLLAMQPYMGNGFSQQILGYSIMSALGIKSSEL